MKGDTIPSIIPLFGIKGIADPFNTPGSRCTYSKWTDNDGNFWLNGGWMFSPYVYFNDTWKYEISNNCWTWYNGFNDNDTGFAIGNCSEDTANVPPLNYENKFSWKDNCGNFWMLSKNNLVWEFTPSSGKWNLTQGMYDDTIPHNYGIQGIPDTANHPGFTNGAETWTDNDGNFWYLQTSPSLLWKFEPDLNCSGCGMALPVAAFSSVSQTICPGSCTNFINQSFFAANYQWSFPGGIPDTSTEVNPQTICYANPGSYDVQLIASNPNGSDTILLPGFITILPAPPPQGITQSGDTLFANAGGASYQWYYNGSIISGATNYFYLATFNGDYNVLVTDSNGCGTEAAIFNVLTDVYSGSSLESIFTIYPNPARNFVTIEAQQIFEQGIISLSNIQGQMIIEKFYLNFSEKKSVQLDLSMIPSGMYFLEINNSEKTFRTKLVME
jgi:PKD repeat protein